MGLLSLQGASKSGGRLNPYKLGIELYRHIEERWNKGRYGKEYDQCDDMVAKSAWDRGTGQGRAKIFEVRRIYNDVTFLDEYLTPEFCREYKFFAFAYNPLTNRYEISDREFQVIKKKLLSQLTNFGQPMISVFDANRGELKLKHAHEGVDLDMDYARETLKALFHIWKRPAIIETRIGEQMKLIKFDGEEHKVIDTKEGA